MLPWLCEKYFFFFFRIGRAEQNEQLEKLYGAIEFNDRPMLEVKLPTAEPEAFEMILNYIYTDKIDCKRNNDFDSAIPVH